MTLYTSFSVSLVIPSGPGAFLSIGCSASLLIVLWWSVWSWGLSPGISCSIINASVCVVFVVSEPSSFCSLVIVVLFLVLPEASLYTLFHGLVGDVPLDCCFHEFVFTFLIAAWCAVFALVNWFFLLSHCYAKDEFLELDFLANNRRNIGASDCTTLVNLGIMQPSRGSDVTLVQKPPEHSSLF